MSDTIVRGSINGTVSIGRFVVNDYTLTISEIDDGYRLTIQRGSDAQSADIRSLSADEVATLLAAAEIVSECEQATTDAINATTALENISFDINSDMEMEVTIPWQS